MSAPLAGKFQDHYVVLEIEPKADSETIQRAYAKLAQKYHPNNAVTGSAEMFEAVNSAYETLSDPELRSIFDKVKGVGQDQGGPKFSGLEFFDALGREALRRAAILCVLYDRRLNKPNAPSLSMRHLELIVEATAAELASALWYLKQRGLAASDDKSSLQITVDGMDFLESKRPVPEDVMTFIKESAIPPSLAIPAPQEQPKRGQESVLSTLNRALARTSV
jgi:curved DNA-binding protein CbpA